MPADPSGVTTDDQGSSGNGADDRSPAETQDGRSVPPATGDAGRSGPGGARSGKSGGRKRGSGGGDADTSVADGNAEAPEAGGGRAASSAAEVPAAPVTEAAEAAETAAPGAGPATDPTPESATAVAQRSPAAPGGSGAAPTAELPATDPSVGGGPAVASDPGPGSAPVVEPTPGAEPGGPSPDVPGDPSDPAAEPPPAPVLVPGGPTVPPAAGGRGPGRGRHATARRDRTAMRGLRVNQRLWSVDPWSVFKLSILFYFCLALIVLVAGTLLYNGGRRIGTVDQFESFITRMGAYGECVATSDVPEGTAFEEDEDECGDGEVLVGGFELDDGTLFRTAAVGGVLLVLAGSIGNVLMTVLVNLLNEVTGGLRHSVVKEPVARPRGDGPGGPPRPRRQPGVPRPASSGSPPRQPQG
jgi:hypothetical protein